MSQTVEAIFEAGVLRPCSPVSVADGEVVTLTVHTSRQGAAVPTWPDLPPELVTDSDGLIVARGTRITLPLLLRGHFQGASWAEVAERYPTVVSSDWPAIATYVERNAGSLRTVLEEEERAIEELRKASPSGLSLGTLRERWQKKFGSSFPQV